MIKELIGEMEFKYPGVWVDEYVVMPDHVHMIIRLKNNRPMDGNGNGRTRGSARTENISLAEVVQPMDGNGNVGANPRICPLNGINNRPMDGNGNGRTRGSARTEKYIIGGGGAANGWEWKCRGKSPYLPIKWN